MAEKKYIFENGVMKINPAYKAEQANQGNPSTVDQGAIAIVSSTNDIQEATQTQQQATGEPMHLSESTTSSMEILQDKDFTDKFQSPTPIDGGALLDKLSNIFARYEVPIGLINKLLALQEYKLNFIVDDSGSMTQSTDVLASQATRWIQDRRRGNTNGYMTRWEEAEDRIHIMIDMLSYIPTNTVTISFLNRGEQIVLNHQGKTPEQFAQEAHQQIFNIFNRGPNGGTPMYRKLSQSLNQNGGPTMHYVFTDGVPSDADIKTVQNLVLHRPNPQNSPLTFMSCTDQDQETEWMKTIEEEAPFTAELDDFDDEKREVQHDQGISFPFSKGFWLLCQLVAAINPDDLDAMDESRPFTKYTLDALMGRTTTDAEYRYYWDNHPTANRQYSQYFQRFATEKTVAKVIVPNAPGLPGGNPQYPTPPGGNPQYPTPGNPQYPGGNPQYPTPGNPQYPGGNPQYPTPGNPQYPTPYPGGGNPQYPQNPGNPQYPNPNYPGTNPGNPHPYTQPGYNRYTRH